MMQNLYVMRWRLRCGLGGQVSTWLSHGSGNYVHTGRGRRQRLAMSFRSPSDSEEEGRVNRTGFVSSEALEVSVLRGLFVVWAELVR